jgi:type IV pilus assembly protein PilB
LPADFVSSHNVLPLFKVRSHLTIAMPEPSNLFLIEEIAQVTGCKVQVVAATAADIARNIEAMRADATQAGTNSPHKIDLHHMPVLDDAVRADPAELEMLFGLWSPENIVNFILQDAHAQQATEIHVEPQPGDLTIRYRIDGALRLGLKPPYRHVKDLLQAFKDIAGPGATPEDAGGTGTAKVSISGHDLTLHIWTFAARDGERMLIRLSQYSEDALSLERLGFDLQLLQNYHKVLQGGSGMVLVAGPRHSGKTTTLYASLLGIDRDHMNICTLEDPIITNLPGVNQFQLDSASGMSARKALEAVLRQSPDVILLNGVGDVATSRMAAEAAASGLLVLMEVPASGSAAAIMRAARDGAGGATTVECLKAVLAQRLVRKVCPLCRTQYQPPQETWRKFHDLFMAHAASDADMPTPPGESQADEKAAPVEVFYHGEGCGHCGQTGYAGRIGLFELIVLTPAIEKAICSVLRSGRNMPSGHDLARALRSAGAPSMIADGVEKVRAGLTTPEEVLGLPG